MDMLNADSGAGAGTAAAEVDEFVIQGTTRDGKPFRPSDWADRLCGIMSQFGGDHRMQYSPYVHPITSRGVKCVVVDIRLHEVEPMAYGFLMNFAKDNELLTRPGRIIQRPDEEGKGAPQAQDKAAG
jgi:hypothetical protein